MMTLLGAVSRLFKNFVLQQSANLQRPRNCVILARQTNESLSYEPVMETNPILSNIRDLTERVDALRGYL